MIEPAGDFMQRAILALSRELDDVDALLETAAQPFAGLALGPWPEGPALADALGRGALALPTIRCDLQVARLAVLCGSMVERGGPASAIAPALLERARPLLARARELVTLRGPEDDDAAPDMRDLCLRYPAQGRALLGAELTALALMTTLCRDKPTRIAARRTPGLAEDLEAIEDDARSAYYVRSLLETVDDLELEVIHVETRRGFRLRVSGVRSSFHLFTLIQGALIGDPAAGLLPGPAPDPEVVAVARGELRYCDASSDTAAWHYAQWTAWTPEGLRPGAIDASIWGEASPLQILPLRGVPTMLLAPKVLGARSWDVSFLGALHDAHRVELEVTARLDEAAVAERLAAMVRAGAD
ncbi:MAG: hypothetical protein R3A51_14435 [Nannocystaceae bacterium]